VIFGYVALGLVVSVVALFVVTEVARFGRIRPLRDAQRAETVRFQAPLLWKRDPSAGTPRWALGAAGFKLIVRQAMFAIVGISPSQSRYLQASRARMRVEQAKGPTGAVDWLVLSAIDADRPVRFWIRPGVPSATVRSRFPLAYVGTTRYSWSHGT